MRIQLKLAMVCLIVSICAPSYGKTFESAFEQGLEVNDLLKVSPDTL